MRHWARRLMGLKSHCLSSVSSKPLFDTCPTEHAGCGWTHIYCCHTSARSLSMESMRVGRRVSITYSTSSPRRSPSSNHSLASSSRGRLYREPAAQSWSHIFSNKRAPYKRCHRIKTSPRMRTRLDSCSSNGLLNTHETGRAMRI